LVLDEMESFEAAHQQELSLTELESYLSWVSQMRSSWPIDRVIITEAKKILTNKPMFTAQQMALLLQKNAYQTAEEALKKAQGPKTPQLKFLEKMWRTEDISAMKLEVHRLASLKIRFAKDVYIKKFAKNPVKIEDLVAVQLLAEVPIDYVTGRPFTLTEAASH